MTGRDVYEDDLKVKNCRVCHHPYPPDTMVRGVCEDCIEEIEADKAGFVANSRKRSFDDD